MDFGWSDRELINKENRLSVDDIRAWLIEERETLFKFRAETPNKIIDAELALCGRLLDFISQDTKTTF